MLSGKKRVISMIALSCICGFSFAAASVASADTRSGASNEILNSPSALFIAGRGIEVTANVDAPKNATQGFYEDGVRDDKRLLKYKSGEDVASWQKNGVLVTSTTERNKLTYKNLIDLEEMTKDDVLLAVQPLSSNQGKSYDFGGLKIYLTDETDEKNYVCIDVNTNTLNQTMIQVCMPNGVSTAYRYGEYHQTEWTATQWWNKYESERRDFLGVYNLAGINSLTEWTTAYNYVMDDENLQIDGGVPVLDMYLEPLTFRYDEEDKTLYMGKACLLDLDHTESVGVGKEFGGFSTNRVTLSVQTYDISGTQASYMVYNVAGQGLCGESVADTEKPYAVENLPTSGELPVAGVGRTYPLFDVTGYDLVDGVIAPKIYAKHESEMQFTALENGKFIPEKSGRYTLRYVFSDAAGNESYKEYLVTAQYAVETISIDVEEAEKERCVGEKIKIPDCSVKGGSGKLNLTTTVMRVSDGYEIDASDGDFLPTVAGEYEVVYSAEDYLGQIARKAFVFDVSASNSPVFEREKPTYSLFVSGVKTLLPELAAYDYTQIGVKKNAVTEIVVRGKGEYANVSETITDRVFTPSLEKFGSEIEIEYKMYCVGFENEAIVRTYAAKIVKAEQAYDYLIYDEEKLSVSLNSNQEKDKYTRFTALEEGIHSIEFAYPVLLNGFEAQLNAGSETFKGKAELRFTDEEDASKRFSIYLSRVDDTSTKAEYRGKSVAIVGAFDSGKILLSVRDGKVYDTTGNELFTIAEKFASETVRVAVVFHSSTVGESLCIKKLGTTYFEGTYRKEVLQKFRDRVAPTILFDGIVPLDGEYGQTIVLPKAKGYDNLSSIVETFVSVKSANGQTIIDGEKADTAYAFSLLEYGTYEVNYTAVDAAGNNAFYTYEITLRDKVAPSIDYVGPTEYRVSIGETFVLRGFDVYDALDADPNYKILVIDADGVIKEFAAGDKYTFSVGGKYTLRHVAYDAAGNYTLLDIRVIVS